jgi:HK97 family phage prohead protease
MRVKSCPVNIKAAGDHEGTPEGVFEAIVAAYNVDSGGDRIIPGAFAKTLATWQESGDPIPLYWSHRMDDPDYNIGHVLEAKETDAGLWVKAQIDLEGPKAQQVYRLLKGRRVKMFSFSYDIEKAQPVTDEKSGDEILDLHELTLFEVGPTPIGMNQQTDLLAVKAAEAAERIARNPIDVGTLPVKSAVGSHSTATDDGAWDGPANEKKLTDELTESTAKAMYAWRDPDGDPSAKSSWKFPHHFVGEGGKPGAASIKACQAGIGILNGSRGGSSIPDEDAKAVWTHLAKHLRDAGVDPHELGSSSDEPQAAKAEEATGEPVDLKACAADLARAAQALLDALQEPEPSKTEDGKATPTPVEPAALSSDGAKSVESVRPATGTASDRLNTDLALLMCEFETI